jgi:hypothetical protein
MIFELRVALSRGEKPAVRLPFVAWAKNFVCRAAPVCWIQRVAIKRHRIKMKESSFGSLSGKLIEFLVEAPFLLEDT